MDHLPFGTVAIKSFTFLAGPGRGLNILPNRSLQVNAVFVPLVDPPSELYELTVEPAGLLYAGTLLSGVNATLDDSSVFPGAIVASNDGFGPSSFSVGRFGYVSTDYDINLSEPAPPGANIWQVLPGAFVDTDGRILGYGIWSVEGTSVYQAILGTSSNFEAKSLTVSGNSYVVFGTGQGGQPAEHLRITEQLVVDGEGTFTSTEVVLATGRLVAEAGSTILITGGASLDIVLGSPTMPNVVGSVEYGVPGTVLNSFVLSPGLEFANADPTLRAAEGAGSTLFLSVGGGGDLIIRSEIRPGGGSNDWDSSGVDLVFTPIPAWAAISLEVTCVDQGGIWFDDSPCIRRWNSLQLGCTGGGFCGVLFDDIERNASDFVVVQTGRDEAMYVDGDVTVNSPAQVNVLSRNVYYTGTYSGQAYPSIIEIEHKTLYGDYDNNCLLHALELTALRQVINGVAPYDPLFDFDCDGQVTNEVELEQFLFNVMRQDEVLPELCGQPQGAGSGDSGTEFIEMAQEELVTLAAWVAES